MDYLTQYLSCSANDVIRPTQTISFVRGVTEGGAKTDGKVVNPDEIDIDMDVDDDDDENGNESENGEMEEGNYYKRFQINLFLFYMINYMISH